MNEASMATEELFRVTLSGITYTFRIAEAIINGAQRISQNSREKNEVMWRYLNSLENEGQGTPGQVKIKKCFDVVKAWHRSISWKKTTGLFQQRQRQLD